MIMTIMEFAHAIAEEIGGEVRVVNKNGLRMTSVTPSEGNIRPNVYVNDYFYEGLSVSQAAERVKELIEQNKDAAIPDLNNVVSTIDNAEPYLKVRLVNENCGYDVKSSAAEYGFEDLCLVPYIEGIQVGNAKGSIRVTSELIERWGVSAEDVIKKAIRNSKPEEYNVCSMASILAESMQMDAEAMEAMCTGPKMYVVTNQDKANGAYGVIALRETLEEMFPEGYVVLPSSIHECIVVSADTYDDDMNNMVTDVNESTVDPVERLGDHAYIIKEADAALIA